MKNGFDVSDLCSGREDGTTRYTFELAKRMPGLSKKDWHYFAPCEKTLTSDPSPLSRRGDLRWHSSPWPRYWTQSRLPIDLYRYPVDVMFMPIQQLPFIRPGRMKTVAVVHDLAFHVYPEQFTYKDWMLQHIFTAYACRRADEIIAVSRATADDITKYYGRRENVNVVHHGVDHDKFKPADITARPKRPYILYVGQIQPRKNISRLVAAFELLSARGEDLKLVIAGGHGWLNSSIFRNIELSPERQHIELTGTVSDEKLVELYQNAEVFALPSLYEGFGMPVLEAMACGAPVVTSNVSSLPEIAGDAAVLVDPESVEEIADGILDAMKRREELRGKGFKRAREFSWDKTAQETLAVISGML